MQKQKFLNTITQYCIGSNPPVKYTVKDNTLTIHFRSEQKDLRGVVEVSDIEMEDNIFGVYDSEKFSRILGALDNDISVKIEKSTLTLSDENTVASFMLSPLDIIYNEYNEDPEVVSPFKEIPEPNLKFELTQELVQKFIKAKNALPESSIVAFQGFNTIGSDIEMILNYSTHPTNQIKIQVNGEVTKDLDITAFSADYIKEILIANKDFTKGEIIIYSKVIEDPNRGTRIAAGMDIDFEGPDYKAKYRLQKIELV